MDQTDIDELVAEVTGLDRFLLALASTAAPDPLPEDERRAISGFIILCHSEIESFLEGAFYDYGCSLVAVDSSGNVKSGLYQIVVKLSSQLQKQLKSDDFTPSKILATIPNLMQTALDQNMGIKIANVRTMAQSVGVDFPRLESSCADLLNALEVLGLQRGRFAHNGAPKLVASNQQMTPVPYAADARRLVSNVTDRLPELVTFLGSFPVAGRKRGVLDRSIAALPLRVRQVAHWWSQRPF